MCRLFKNFLVKPVAMWVVSSMVLFGVSTGNTWAQSSPSAGLVRSATMAIEEKTEDAFISGERRFLVTEATTIIDAFGKRIGLGDLSLPAEAEVQYKLIMDQPPLVLRIVVK